MLVLLSGLTFVSANMFQLRSRRGAFSAGGRRNRGTRRVLAAALLPASALWALDPAHTVTQYDHNVWSAKNGSLSATILALAQTRDGELWIGTETGLLRFDGEHFVPWEAPPGQSLPATYITALAAAPDGSLWIGSREGLSHWKDDKVANYAVRSGQRHAVVSAIAIDPSGTVWVGTGGFGAGELCRVDGKKLRCYGLADGLPGPGVLALYVSRSGDLWAGGAGGLCRWRAGRLEVYRLAQPSDMVYSIAEDANRQIWVAAGGKDHFLQLETGPLGDSRLVPRPNQPSILALKLLEDRDGGRWIGTAAEGLLHEGKGITDRFSRADGLSGDRILSLFEDREGNVWVATSDGLDRFRDYPVTTVSTRQGLSNDAVGSVFAAGDGGVWIGTDDGLDRMQDGRVTVYRTQAGLPENAIRTIFEEQSGRLWVNAGSRLSFFAQNRFQVLPGRTGIILAAAEDREHNVWFSAARQGLFRVRGEKVDKAVPWTEFGNREARSLAADPASGALWLGFTQGGLGKYHEGQPTRYYSTSEGLGRGAIGDLHFGRDGALWAATEGGLSRVREGKIATLTKANALACDAIHAIVEDQRGDFWLNTACGLIHIEAGELAAWESDPKHKIRSRLYDASDGMRVRPNAGGYSRRAARSKDGRLWFAVLDGVAVIDPGHIPQNHVPPPVRIDGITADRKPYAVRPQLALPPLSNELEIDYTAFSFAAPEKVRFKYMLEGFDTGWKDAGSRRQAIYTNLPPRRYQFRVEACNNDGLWNLKGAALEFSIEPTLVQTLWFRIVAAVAFAAMLFGLYFARVRYLRSQMQLRFEERTSERTRISRELHDDLLQNITGFSLQLDALAKGSAVPQPIKERLRTLREEAEDWLRKARQTVTNLRAPLWEESDLTMAIRDLGKKITSRSGVRFRMTVSGRRCPAAPEIIAQVYHIVQEAMRNAIHHGHAEEIVVSLRFSPPDLLRIQIRDHGLGFDPEEPSDKMNHWGMATMRERAQEIGAQLTITTAPGKGTSVEIVVNCKGQGKS